MTIALLLWAALSLMILGLGAVASAMQGYPVRQCICDSILLALVWPTLLIAWMWRGARGEA